MSRKAKLTFETESGEFASILRELMRTRGLTQTVVADGIGMTRQAISLYTTGQSTPDINTLFKMADFFCVSSDYLIGRTRAAAPDNFIQEVVARYGLSEAALKFLEQLNTPIDNDDDSVDVETEKLIYPIMKEAGKKQALSMLNDLLTAPTEDGWETYGSQILITLYKYCRYKFKDMKLQHYDVLEGSYSTLTAEKQRLLEIMELNNIIARLRDKLTREG